MADKEDGQENLSRGNEWEVVSLTASAYAAAPGPREVEVKDDEKGDTYEHDEAETSHGLFMSRHFVFPPSHHENLPLESKEISNDCLNKQDVISEVGVECDRSSGKDEADLSLEGLNVPEEFLGSHFLEKGDKLSVQSSEFDEPTPLQGLSFVDKEQNLFHDTKFTSFLSETANSGSTEYDENMTIPEITDPSGRSLDSFDGKSQSPRISNDGKCDGSGLPCEAWWKKKAASLYSNAKEANTFWSIFVAAAVMGIVILGQRWQKGRRQVLQLKWQSNIGEEKMTSVLGPIFRFKDIGSHQRSSFVGSASQN